MSLILPSPSDAEIADGGISSISTFLTNRQLLLAIDDASSACLGFADFSFKPNDATTQGTPTATGSIRFLWYALGHRAVGQALLDAAESSLRDAGATSCEAFQTEYLAFHKNLSDRLMHVRALFTQNGYTLAGGEVYINWENFGESLQRLEADGACVQADRP